jgi:hypothetical protein
LHTLGGINMAEQTISIAEFNKVKAELDALKATVASRVRVVLSKAGDMVVVFTGTRANGFSMYKNEVPVLFDPEVVKQAIALAAKIPDDLPKVDKAAARAATSTTAGSWKR